MFGYPEFDLDGVVVVRPVSIRGLVGWFRCVGRPGRARVRAHRSVRVVSASIGVVSIACHPNAMRDIISRGRPRLHRRSLFQLRQ